MKNLLLILILFLSCNLSAQYKVTKQKVIGWSVLATAGFIDGVVEGYEFDGRTSFERKFGSDPNGYFGSLSHRKKCGWKPFCDFYHDADDFRKIGYISGGVIITLGEKQKASHLLLDLAISFAVSGASKRAGMHWIRN